MNALHAQIQRVEQGVQTPLKNHKNIGFSSYTGPDSLKNRKATKPAFNAGVIIGPPAKRHHRPASETPFMAFRWRADDDPLLVILGSSLPSSTPPPPQKKKKKKKKKKAKNKQNQKTRQSWTPSDKTFWIRAWIVRAVASRYDKVVAGYQDESLFWLMIYRGCWK